MKIQNIFFWRGRVGGGGWSGWGGGGQGRCEQRTDVFVKIKKEKIWGGGSGRGGGCSGGGGVTGWM